MPLRQTALSEFTSSPSISRSSTKYSSSPTKRNINIEINSDDDSDPGGIKFERDVIVVHDSDQSHSDAEEPDEESAPPRRPARTRKGHKTPSVSASSSRSSSVPHASRKKRPRHLVVNSDGNSEENSDENSPEKNSKRRKLVKGKRPETPPPAEEDEDLIEEIDEERIIESRLRDRSKKSAFARNLERLQRRRRGRTSASESENDEDEDNSSESPSSARAGSPAPFKGARPTVVLLDEDEDPEENESMNENEDDFIVQDEGGDVVPELPTMFSMGTFQDLSHHFKVICQLFVHLAVKRPHKRRAFMKNELQKNYFSVPLSIARRKISGMKDSLVTSSVWKPDFKRPLETLPEFRLEHLDFAIPLCDACHLGNRVATYQGVIGGQKYDPLTFEPLVGVGVNPENENDEESNRIDWNLGRFCAARAQVFHTFTHWEYTLYHTLRTEVERLREASLQNGDKEYRVFLPATKGPPPPDDLDDADGIMDWMDGRGIINSQWARMKEMMDRARKLEARVKEAEGDIDIG